MQPKFPVLNMHNSLTNGKVHMYLCTSGQVSESGAISVSCHVNCSNVNRYIHFVFKYLIAF